MLLPLPRINRTVFVAIRVRAKSATVILGVVICLNCLPEISRIAQATRVGADLLLAVSRPVPFSIIAVFLVTARAPIANIGRLPICAKPVAIASAVASGAALAMLLLLARARAQVGIALALPRINRTVLSPTLVRAKAAIVALGVDICLNRLLVKLDIAQASRVGLDLLLAVLTPLSFSIRARFLATASAPRATAGVLPILANAIAGAFAVASFRGLCIAMAQPGVASALPRIKCIRCVATRVRAKAATVAFGALISLK